MMTWMAGAHPGLAPLGPPFLKHGDLVIAHTAMILHYLGPRIGLVGESEAERLHTHQLQLTVTDFVHEAHDTHHPIAVSLYYHDQKPEAKRRTGHFLKERMPKFLGYFERELGRNGGQHMIGTAVSYVDLSMFQILTGLAYAFPNAFARYAREIPKLCALRDRVAARPTLRAYLESPRREPPNEHDLFRHYPELDE